MNSISTKLMIRFTVIIIFTLFILGISLSYLFQEYYYDSNEETFINQGEEIAKLVQSSLHEGNYEETIEFLKNSQRFFEGNAWIVDSKGLILAATQRRELQGVKLKKEEVEKVLKGETIKKRGFSDYFDEPVLLVAVPIDFEDSVIGAVFVYAPLAGISETLDDVKKLILYAALIAIVLTSILSFTLSRSFSKPLKNMKRIAVNMAHGEFDERIGVSSSDEVGQLANSFNYLAERLKNTIHSLQKKEELQRRFVADVSHELRTPLTSIQGFVKALRDGVYESKEDKEEYYEIILGEVRRLIRLVKDLLDLSQIELEQINMDLTPIDLGVIIKNSIRNLMPKIREKDLKIKIDIPKVLSNVIADRDRVEQVLINLTSNAIDFSPSGDQIQISVQEDVDRVLVSIKDFGPGIPKKELEGIWNRFHKVDKARTRDRGGTGLGLSIVREIIRQHKGEVWVESVVGQGAKFTFALLKEEFDE
ncbi:sensor histidine kinase [Halonatronum saccharophilum]|uniref:sensor histidine kinase n=1 Tax=Halonatronum saccharophilum TaxID=150060 RepID=UPI0004B9F445|nr:ATP-binding protein [Halonatronum saccharophilum]